jgi:hypothetical protein
MDRRHFERITCHFDATIVSGDRVYEGFIGNISEEGLEYLMTAYVQSPKDFTPERVVQLSFPLSAEECLELNCEAMWFLRAASLDQTLIGMRILNPPRRYKELISRGHLRKYLCN